MTTEARVVNASPLILYARIDQLVLLEQLAPRLIIPEAALRRSVPAITRITPPVEPLLGQRNTGTCYYWIKV